PLDLVPRLFFSFITRGPTRSTLFPYTTLFRSDEPVDGVGRAGPQLGVLVVGVVGGDLELAAEAGAGGDPVHDHPLGRHPVLGARSEEHTSELQSRENLVCRLLLEKKN